jgi:hypothetical protein
MFPGFLNLDVDEIHLEMASREFSELELIADIPPGRRDHPPSPAGKSRPDDDCACSQSIVCRGEAVGIAGPVDENRCRGRASEIGPIFDIRHSGCA